MKICLSPLSNDGKDKKSGDHYGILVNFKN